MALTPGGMFTYIEGPWNFEVLPEVRKFQEAVETAITAVSGGASDLLDPGANGIVVRTSLGTTVARTLANASAGLTWTNGDGVSGPPTPVFANDLGALEGLSGTGYARRTGTDTWILDSGGGFGGTINSPNIPYAASSSTLADSPLVREDANTIAQRNGTTSQTSFLYRKYVSSSDYERLRMYSADVNNFNIVTEQAGTGTAKSLTLNANGNAVQLNQSSGFFPLSNGTSHLGGSSNQWNRLFLQNGITMGADTSNVIFGTRGQIDMPGTFTDGGVLRFRNNSAAGGTFCAPGNRPTAITVDQNDYTAGNNVSYWQLWSSTAAKTITGYNPCNASGFQQDGQRHMIVNIGSFDIILANQNTSSSAFNRFICQNNANLTIPPGQAAIIIYDSTVQRWRVWKIGLIAAADLPGNFSGFANPTSLIGLSFVNGSATTAMRSDAAPALDQSISPTWTGAHAFTQVITSTGSGTTYWANSGTTLAKWIRVSNSGGNLYAGLESNVAATTWTNSLAYASIIGSSNSTALQLMSNGIIRSTFDTSGNFGVNSTTPRKRLDILDASQTQLRLSWSDNSVYSDFTVNAGGDLTIAPTGDFVFNPTGKDILPTTGYDLNIGSLSKKYLTLHAAELWVETLVAQSTMATIGGRILVGPTTQLTSDLSSGTTSIIVKHNNLSSGDRVYMEANGQVEFMAITSSASGGGPYTYTVTRDLDGSGVNNWSAGDAVFNTGQTGNGFIDLYSVRGVKSGSQVGPTIVGNVRNSSTYNDWTEHWAIGNLNGLYGYSSSIYGVGLGKYSTTSSYVTLDSTNGLQMYGANSKRLWLKIDGSGYVANNNFSWDTSGNVSISGNATIANWTISSSRISSTHVYLDSINEFFSLGDLTPSTYFLERSGFYVDPDALHLGLISNGGHSLSLDILSGQYASMTHNSFTDITGAITVEAWVKISSYSTNYFTIVGKSNSSSTAGYWLFLDGISGGVFRFTCNNGTTSKSALGTTVASTGVWYHVAGVYDGSNNVDIYVNGVREGRTSGLSSLASDATDFNIGKSGFTTYYWNGKIDEVRISNTALYTQTFIPSGHPTVKSSTQGLWKFENSDLTDSSGHGNTLTDHGGVTFSTDIPGNGGTLASGLSWDGNILNLAEIHMTLGGTSSYISLGNPPPTSATSGTGVWIDRNGVQTVASGSPTWVMDSMTGNLHTGDNKILMNTNGINFTRVSGFTPSLNFYDLLGGTQIGFLQSDNSSAFWGHEPTATHDGNLILYAVGSPVNKSVTFQIYAPNTSGLSYAMLYGANLGDLGGLTIGNFVSPSAMLDLYVQDSVTNSITDSIISRHRSTGTPTSSFGSGILFDLKSSTTNDRNAARIAAIWTNATDASRTSNLIFQAVTSAGTLTTAMQIGQGITVGGPTGGDLGAGTINVASNIFLNGSVYTFPHFGFEQAYTGKVVRYADRMRALGFDKYKPLTLEDFEAYTRKHMHFPYFADKEHLGLFDGSERHLLITEELAIHMFDMNKRLKLLEEKFV